MVTKTVKFDYTGGKYTQNLNVRGTNLPWRYECDADWIIISTGGTSINIEVGAIYDFNTRTGTIRIFDKFNNEIDLVVEQTGYYDLSVEMPADIVLFNTYYDENDTYDVYLTVYGGPTQMIDCKELEPYIQKVWDNSDMYNDFVLRIPKGLEGEFTVKHSDCNGFEEFCKTTGVEYPKSGTEKKLTIKQLSPEDTIGKMVISIDGKEYTNNSETVELEVSSETAVRIWMVSNEFIIMNSKTSYSVVKNAPFNVQSVPNWVDMSVKDNRITLKCNEKNNFNDRYTQIKIENSQNKNQYIMVRLKQKSGS